MNAGGLLMIIAGIWFLTQTFKGGLLELVGVK